MEGVGSAFLYAAAIIMILVASGLIYALVSGNERKVPDGPVQWMGTVLAGLVVLSGIWLIGVTMKADTVAGPPARLIASPDQIEEMDLASPAVDFPFRLVKDDNASSLFDYKGKVIILNLWATWCPPCLTEIPDLNKIHLTYADSGVVVLSLSDERRDDLLAFSDQLRIATHSGYLSPSSDLPQLVKAGFEIRPTSYIIDRGGTVRKYILGARNYRYFERAIRPYL